MRETLSLRGVIHLCLRKIASHISGSKCASEDAVVEVVVILPIAPTFGCFCLGPSFLTDMVFKGLVFCIVFFRLQEI